MNCVFRTGQSEETTVSARSVPWLTPFLKHTGFLDIGFLPKSAFSPAALGFPSHYPFAGSPTGGNFKLLNGTVLGRKGDYDKDPGDNSQVGVRIGATSPQGLTFTLNYLYQRTAQDDGMNTTSLRGRNQCVMGTLNCVSAFDVALQQYPDSSAAASCRLKPTIRTSIRWGFPPAMRTASTPKACSVWRRSMNSVNRLPINENQY